MPAQVLKTLKSQAMPGEFDGVAAQARSLREWLRGFVRSRSGSKLSARDLRHLDPLNRLLARDERFDQIVGKSKGEAFDLELRTLRRWRTPESVLLGTDHRIGSIFDQMSGSARSSGSKRILEVVYFVVSFRGRAVTGK